MRFGNEAVRAGNANLHSRLGGHCEKAAGRRSNVTPTRECPEIASSLRSSQ
jgi:hypothetical protein